MFLGSWVIWLNPKIETWKRGKSHKFSKNNHDQNTASRSIPFFPQHFFIWWFGPFQNSLIPWVVIVPYYSRGSIRDWTRRKPLAKVKVTVFYDRVLDLKFYIQIYRTQDFQPSFRAEVIVGNSKLSGTEFRSKRAYK